VEIAENRHRSLTYKDFDIVAVRHRFMQLEYVKNFSRFENRARNKKLNNSTKEIWPKEKELL
jgi:hypothetical protein